MRGFSFLGRGALRQCLLALDQLQQAFFSDDIGGESSAALAEARSALYHAMQALRRRLDERMLQKVECLYEAVFLLGLLRFRVTDRALFEVCHQELAEMSRAISALLRDAGRPSMSESLLEFDRVRENFKHLYEGVLCITAGDPEVFQFFFAHLETFRMCLMRLFGEDSYVFVD